MTTGPGSGRLGTSEAARRALDLAEAMAARRTEPESTVTISTTAKHGSAADPAPKRMHTWEITVRGLDAGECARQARLLDASLSAEFAHEIEGADDLAAKLAATVVGK